MYISRLDPKNLFPKVFRVGTYYLKTKCNTNMQVSLDQGADARVFASMQNLFENFFDFEFELQMDNLGWEMMIPDDVVKQIGRK